MNYQIDFSDSEPYELYTEHIFSNQPVNPNEIWENWLGITVDTELDEERKVPTEEQQKALDYFVQNQAAIFESITDYILNNQKAVLLGYVNREDDFPDYLDEFKGKMDVHKQLTIDALCVRLYAKDGIAYTGYFGNCEWDPEHGCGILMHGDRVIRIGGHDTAFSGTKEIKNEGGAKLSSSKTIETLNSKKEIKYSAQTEKIKKLKWWKFWK